MHIGNYKVEKGNKMNNQSFMKLAVVGMACQLPGAANISEYWEKILNAEKCFTTFTNEQLKQSGVGEELINNPNYIRTKGVIPNIDLFDADFFEFTPKDAMVTDPQHRLFLECAWEALEDAGYDSEQYKGKIGVFGGQGMNDYLHFNILPNLEKQLSASTLRLAIGNDKDSMTTKVSYKMDLKGPAVTIQSSSSTSLTSIGIACQNLLSYESDMAIAGGVCIGVPQEYGYLYQEGGIFSNDGNCRTFDDNSSGFVISSGVGVVILKRLDDAISDNDHIYCVIDSICINNDGKNKASYTAPSSVGIAEVIEETLELSGFNPEDIGYVETHGTGTKLGDFLEIQAMKDVYEQWTNKKNYCAIGSVKPNIGHVDAAAGVAGFIKVALCIYHGVIPAHIGMQTPNRHIDFINSPFYINQISRPWITNNGQYRVAAVTSIGMGGTNAHAILSSFKEDEKRAQYKRNNYILLLSAKTEHALSEQHKRLFNFLLNNEADLRDVAFTLQIGRKHFPYRAAYVCKDKREALKYLNCYKKNICKDNRVVYIINWVCVEDSKKKYKELCKKHPILNDYYNAYIQETSKYINIDRLEKIKNCVNISNNISLYSAIFNLIYSVSFAMLIRDYGIQVQAIGGEQINEFAAAYLANVMSFKEVIQLICKRVIIQEKNTLYFPPDLYTETSISWINVKPPTIDFYSYSKKGWIKKGEKQTLEYWNNLVIPENNIETYRQDVQHDIFFELSLFNNRKLDELIGLYWCNKGKINWNLYQKGLFGKRISLPTYPFEKKSYWMEPKMKSEMIVENKMDESDMINEKSLTNIWKQVLGIDKIEVNDNYFELGGTSLLAIQIVSMISIKAQIPFSLEDFYENPTISGLMRKIESTQNSGIKEIEKISSHFFTESDIEKVREYIQTTFGDKTEITEIYPLVSGVERILFKNLYYKNQNEFHQNYIFSLSGNVNITILLEAFYRICYQFDSLHSVYSYRLLEKPIQIVISNIYPEFNFQDLRFKKDFETIINNYRFNDMKRRFDLLHDLPLRLSLFQTSNKDYRIMLSVHHIALDAISFGIITKEFLKCYMQLLTKKSDYIKVNDSYKDYIKWYHFRDTVRSVNYWKGYLRGYNKTPIKDLSIRKNENSDNTLYKFLSFNKEYVRKIRNIAKELKISVSAFYILVWCIVLQSFDEVDELLFGVVVSGRTTILKNSMSAVGMLSNIVPLRVKVKDNSVVSILYAIQKDLMKCNQYMDVSLLDLIKASSIEPGHFNYIINIEQNYDYSISESMPFKINSINLQQQSGYPICCIVKETENELIFRLEYKESYIGKRQIDKIIDIINSVIINITTNDICETKGINELNNN